MNYSRFILIQGLVFLSLYVSNPSFVKAAGDADTPHSESILENLITDNILNIILEHARCKSNYAQMFHEGRSSEQRKDESDVVLTISLQLAEDIIRSSNYVQTINSRWCEI